MGRGIAPAGLRYTAPGWFGSEVPELDTHRMPGGLYVVATPIGNLEDISGRACTVMREVNAVLAEDTRRTRVLLERYAISTPVRAFHEHNEREQTPRMVARMLEGQRFALVSDAGTPLVSDPGFVLVRAARSHDVPVHCVPGPSAVTAALSVAGLPPTVSRSRGSFRRGGRDACVYWKPSRTRPGRWCSTRSRIGWWTR